MSWSELPANEGVEIKITAPVTFEHAREVEIVDWPASATPRPSGLEETSLVEGTASLALELESGALASTSVCPLRAKAMSGGSEHAKQGGPNQSAASLVATAKVFRPRSSSGDSPSVRSSSDFQPPVRVIGGRGRQVAPSTTATSVPQNHPRVRVVPQSEIRPSTTADPEKPTKLSRGRERKDPQFGLVGSTLPPPPRRLALHHLPSVHITLRLPGGYPDNEPPHSISISAEGDWLGLERRRAAERKLASLYTGDECLLYILDAVSSASSDFNNTFALDSPLVLRQAAPAAGASSDPVPLSTFLVAYDRRASSTQFATSSHACPLCFTTQRGSACVRIASCGCVFCVACLRDYFSLLITEGLVRSVACPSRGCVEQRARWEKEGASSRTAPDQDDSMPGRVTASEVEELVGEEGRKRWEWLREKARVESGGYTLSARHPF